MTTEEHLNRIVAKCLGNIEAIERLKRTTFSHSDLQSEAAFRSTIAACNLAISLCNPVGTLNQAARKFIDSIITAWPESLL